MNCAVNSFTISWSSDFPVELDVNSFTISWSVVYLSQLIINNRFLGITQCYEVSRSNMAASKISCVTFPVEE